MDVPNGAESNGNLPQPEGVAGERLTILTIDGGGVRGIIPALCLEFLESQLQALDGARVRLADYFDVIGGTSTGGLIASMLTAPDAHKRPKFTAQETKNFYLEKASVVFPKPGPLSGVTSLFGPKYSPKGLRNLLKEYFGDLRVSDALTDVLITSFDVRTQQPVFFNRAVAQRNARFDVPFVDACLGTTAAPTYFPAHYFEVADSDLGSGKKYAYHLIDGAIAANNPTQVAILHSLKDLAKRKSAHKSRIPSFSSYKQLLVLSLGTGDQTVSHDARKVEGWGTLSWVVNDGHSPVMEMFQNASAYLVDFDVAIRFQIDQVERNYLRIQTHELDGELAVLDKGSQEHMRALIAVAERVLEARATFRSAVDGELVQKPYLATNKDALRCFARWLSEERKARLAASEGSNPTARSKSFATFV